MQSDLLKFVASIPELPGVYRFYDATDKLIYVGKAINLKRRVKQYFSSNVLCAKTKKMINFIVKINFILTENDTKAWLLESDLIYQHKPKFNIKLKDSKAYPFIAINVKHKYPRVFVTWKNNNKDCLLFGPFVSKKSIYKLLDFLQYILKLRSCKDAVLNNRSRPCVLFEIGRCCAPCVKEVSFDEYKTKVDHIVSFLSGKTKHLKAFCIQQMQQASENKAYEAALFYRDRLRDIEKIYYSQHNNINEKCNSYDVYAATQLGNKVCVAIILVRDNQILDQKNILIDIPLEQSIEDCLLRLLQQYYLHKHELEMLTVNTIVVNYLSDDFSLLKQCLLEKYNVAFTIIKPEKGGLLDHLSLAEINAKNALSRSLKNFLAPLWAESSLQKALSLSSVPKKIECFDISHFQGDCAVASCVVFGASGAIKAAYRFYKIKPTILSDDCQSIYLAVKKRYEKKLPIDMPDLILIDGGLGQLHAAKQALIDLNLNLKVFAVSKGVKRKVGDEKLHFINSECLQLAYNDKALHCIQAVRDEAHRYALYNHKKYLQKKSIKSVLESIPGIGKKKAQILLGCFVNINSLGKASIKEIEQIPGISKKLASNIFDFFNR